MDALPLWIGRNIMLAWGFVLILALAVGDLAWRRARRLRLAATGRRDYLALQPRTALLLLVLFAALLALLAWAVKAHTALTAFDAALAQELRSQLPQGVLQVIAVVTNLGRPILLAFAGGVVALLLALRRTWLLFVPWCVAVAGTAASDDMLKHLVQRARPFDGHGFVPETGYSFPSGHASMSMVFYGMLAYLLLRQFLPRHHRDTVAAAILLVGIIGISRVLLQAHYLSDVLAGYALGAFWLVLGVMLAEWLRREGQPR